MKILFLSLLWKQLIHEDAKSPQKFILKPSHLVFGSVLSMFEIENSCGKSITFFFPGEGQPNEILGVKILPAPLDQPEKKQMLLSC